MKAYRVNVNGNVYEITLEVIDKADIKAPAAAPVAAPAAAPVAGGQTVTSPLPGTVLKVVASVGQAVKAGDTLFIIEAMKMENEIPAPADGTVASINVTSGAAVDAGTVLCSLS